MQEEVEITHRVKEATKSFYQWIDDCTRLFFIILNQLNNIYKDYCFPKVTIVKKVYFPINFASSSGGARIVMKGSDKIKAINSILDDGFDSYMYTTEQAPIKFILGLNEEIAIESIIIKSFEMYSRITKEFKVEGKFTLEDKKWVWLGTFTATNKFG